MARLPRLAIGGELHLVAQRGVAGTALFPDAADRAHYTSALRDAAKDCGVAVHAYVLLEEEVQLLLTPSDAAGLTRAMQRTARRYVGGLNSRHARQGSVWHGRFRSTVVEPSWLLRCMACLEQAPLRRGLVSSPGDWPWSSAGHHLGRRADPLVVTHPQLWTLGNTPFEREARYREFLERMLTPKEVGLIASALDGGWVLGSAAYAGDIERRTARRARPSARGRPAKAAA